MSAQAYRVRKITLAPTPMVLEGTFRRTELGSHASTMEFWRYPAECQGFIEWDIPSLEEVEHIGVWWEERADGTKWITDYDGVMSLPAEAAQWLRDLGFKTGDVEDGT